MPLQPRRIPARFNRPVTRATRDFVRRREDRRTKHRRERWLRILRRFQRRSETVLAAGRRWMVVFLIGMVLLGAGLVLFSPLLHVREIRIKRTDPRLDIARIEQALAPVFGRHIFFLSSSTVGGFLRESVPDIQDVIVQKNYPSRLLVQIGLQPLVARLSLSNTPGTESGADASDGYTYLTKEGLLIALPFAEADVPLPLISVVDWGTRPQADTLLLGPDFLQAMDLAGQAVTREFGMAIRGRTLFLRAREFHLQTGKVALWFDVKSPLSEQLARLRTFLHTVPMREVREYIDLRIAGRVIYR